MASQLSDYGAAMQANWITGNTLPIVSGSAPSSPLPGQVWIDTGHSNAIKTYLGATAGWVVSTGARYLMLLTADPTLLTPPVTLSQLTEVVTSGYSRQQVAWNAIPDSLYPATTANSAVVTFGAFTADMAYPTKWAAMTDVATGVNGNFLYSWVIPSQQVDTSQYINLAAGGLTLASS